MVLGLRKRGARRFWLSLHGSRSLGIEVEAPDFDCGRRSVGRSRSDHRRLASEVRVRCSRRSSSSDAHLVRRRPPPGTGRDAERLRRQAAQLGQRSAVRGREGNGALQLQRSCDIAQEITRPEPFIPSSIGHHEEWIQAIKTGGTTTCNFDYSGALTEAVLLGVASHRSGEALQWDAKNLRVTNSEKAQQFIHKEYRKGWTL